MAGAPFPRLAYVARRAYWEVSPGVYQVTESEAVRPAMNGAGYRDLAALCRLKGDPTPPPAPLPTPESLGLVYVGPVPEFAAHMFRGENGVESLYTRHPFASGGPVFEWTPPRSRRAYAFRFVDGSRYPEGRAHDGPRP